VNQLGNLQCRDADGLAYAGTAYAEEDLCREHKYANPHPGTARMPYSEVLGQRI
jgi:hypothetical protein